MKRALARYASALWQCLAWAGMGIIAAPMAVLLAAAMAASLVVAGMFLLPGIMWLQRRLATAGAWLAQRAGARPIELWRPRASEATLAGRSQQIITSPSTWLALVWDLALLGLVPVTLLAAPIPWLGVRWSRLQARLAAALLHSRGRKRTRQGDGTRKEPGAPRPALRAGHGLVGMAERAAMLGGTLHTGPTPGGGFEVRAILPLTEAAAGGAPVGTEAAGRGGPAAGGKD